MSNSNLAYQAWLDRSLAVNFLRGIPQEEDEEEDEESDDQEEHEEDDDEGEGDGYSE